MKNGNSNYDEDDHEPIMFIKNKSDQNLGVITLLKLFYGIMYINNQLIRAWE